MIILKIFIILIYLILLIALYCAMDYFTCTDVAKVATLVDPINVSLRQLRWLLHARGINYYGAIEKNDLSDLVSASGPVTQNEVKVAQKLDEDEGYSAVTFSTSNDLQASIDNSEDVWLVQIVAYDKKPLMKQEEWEKLTRNVQKAGIRSGQVFCQETPEMCKNSLFGSSQLLISNHYKKDLKRIHRKHYLTRKADANTALNWVSDTVGDSLKKIVDVDQFHHDWFRAKSRRHHPVQLVYVSSLSRVPMMFASLNAKFRNRIRFGRMHLNADSLPDFQLLLGSKKALPKSFVCLLTKQQTYIYSTDTGKGNYLHFRSLYIFLQTFNPDINLMFTWSIYLCNFLASLSVVTASGPILQRLVRTIKSFVIYNAVLLGAWLLISSYQPEALTFFANICLFHLQGFATSELASDLRWYVQAIVFQPFQTAIGFLVFFCLVVFLLKKFNLIIEEDDSDTLSDLLLLNENRSTGYNDISRRWVERLATPGLWLQPLVPSDYIDNLPVWLYSGTCIESSDDSDASVGASKRATSSPGRSWSLKCQEETRGRSCFSSRRRAASNLGRGLLRSIRSCLRGKSPRFKRMAGPPNGMREDQCCSICLENYKSHSTVCGLPCGHVFHHDCVLQWLHGDTHCCPICRWPAYQFKEINVD